MGLLHPGRKNMSSLISSILCPWKNEGNAVGRSILSESKVNLRLKDCETHYMCEGLTLIASISETLLFFLLFGDRQTDSQTHQCDL